MLGDEAASFCFLHQPWPAKDTSEYTTPQGNTLIGNCLDVNLVSIDLGQWYPYVEFRDLLRVSDEYLRHQCI